ncbi:hypothetical protein F6Q07_10340 [Pectobacterium parmentieri]|nr:hypothetical protein C5E26_21965 [Pectobacterium parmentieri]AYH29640.1 hypothetical protein C5E20_22310 [Pectobacterium parmentieri]AYH34058.1 hypothetical protein C5E19_21945 [Pectobacterium parmentieri]MBI0518530.1 hypothetical protein [Pectobacterium parmentieri]
MGLLIILRTHSTTMQEVPKDVHSELTHKGGASNIRNNKCG